MHSLSKAVMSEVEHEVRARYNRPYLDVKHDPARLQLLEEKKVVCDQCGKVRLIEVCQLYYNQLILCQSCYFALFEFEVD